MSDPTETVTHGPTAGSVSRTETVPDGPTADSGSREWTQRFLVFGFFERMRDCRDRVANHARLGNAFAHALAFPLTSQILNEMSYFHRRTAEAKGNERLGALQWW